MLYSLTGDLTAPLINRNAIKAAYYSANAQQIQAVYRYEQTILTAYVEVANQLSMISNLGKSYDLKSRQVQALTESIDIANVLFRSARADYMEVLLTQREALESKFELIETKKQQMNAMVNITRRLVADGSSVEVLIVLNGALIEVSKARFFYASSVMCSHCDINRTNALHRSPPTLLRKRIKQLRP